ncbi:MAG: TonB-dependent receptor [Gammaproteobacteria bacterium]|nr:TonB-dependent receptor [Gammaproteobacteria bacterium]
MKVRITGKQSRITAAFTALAVAATGMFAVAPPAAGEEIETILVTTRKREEALQDVPVAVSAFDAEALAERQIRDIGDLARFAPGLNFAKAFGRSTERPVIRGLGNVLAGVQFGVESGAAYFVDGMYYPGDLQSLNIKDVERVEVIRGPQSALYGRNTYSGAINFVTKSPADVTEGNTALRFGQDGEAELTAGASGQLIDGVLGASINARFYSFDGEYTNTVTGKKVGDEETDSVSGTLDWQAADNVRVRTRLAFQKDTDGTRPFFLQPSEMNNCYPGTRSLVNWPDTGSSNNFQYFCGKINRPGDTVSLNDGPALPGQPTPIPGLPDVLYGPGAGTSDIYQSAQGLPFSGVERDLKYGSVLADWDIGGSGWTLSTGLTYRTEDRRTGSDSDHSGMNYIASPTALANGSASEHFDTDDYSAEVRLESPVSERLRWLVGAFYYDQSVDTNNIAFESAARTTYVDLPVYKTEDTRNWAVFGSVEYDWLDNVSTTAELRYFDEEKSAREPGSAPPYDESIDFSEVAPRLTADWKITDDVLLYGIYSRGYKPGGLNGVPGRTLAIANGDDSLRTYDQEESDNYEIGMKNSLLGGALTANIAVFFIDAKDIQLTTPLAAVPGSTTLTSIVTNQGDGEVRGVEIELQYAITDELSVGANYALADSEFTDGCDEFQWVLTSGGGQAQAGDPCTGNDINGRGDGSIEGNQFPLSAKNMWGAFVNFRRPVTNTVEMFASADYSWEDEKPVQVHNMAWVPDATIVNAQIGIDTGRMTLTLYGRNLTDEDAPSMVTRWLQYPLVSNFAGGVGGGNSGAGIVLPPDALPGASCGAGTAGCSTSFPRAFFGDMRRGRNFGLELNYKFGGVD